MNMISLDALFVVTFPHTGYSHDTATPDEVFLSRAEAQTCADERNESVAKGKMVFATDKRYFVETLYDRIQTIKDECRREGETESRPA